MITVMLFAGVGLGAALATDPELAADAKLAMKRADLSLDYVSRVTGIPLSRLSDQLNGKTPFTGFWRFFVGEMPPLDLSDRLKRDVAMHRAAQLLSDAINVRAGQKPQPLKALSRIEAEWFKQTARQLIEIFELETTGREPDAAVDLRQQQAVARETRIARALEDRLAMERQVARIRARDRGHNLTTFAPIGHAEGEERACCARCARIVEIVIGAHPVLSGNALDEGCLTAAEGA